ncbi:hypothetical protein SBA4_660017 [Candidatus Sulfopaludibacter sp. SbA4]|nr:hypothetical protein SBA4_660017 [Candidatus Sulfopaludibacter sp. SbA4]
MFTPDSKKLCYRMVKAPPSEWTYYRDAGEVRMADLESGRSDPLVPGFLALSYDLSADGREVVMAAPDPEGKQRLWIAAMDRSVSPRQIPNVEGGSPRFGRDGDIVFRHVEGSRMEGTTGFIYRVHRDGTGLRKASPHPVLYVDSISPDRQWVVAWAPVGDNGPPAVQAFPLDGGSPVTLAGGTYARWSPDGRSVAFFSENIAPIPEGRSYLVPLPPGQILPRIPPGGFHSEEEVARLPGARRIDEYYVVPGPSPGQYAFYRGTSLRNLYRIPIP